MTIMISIGEMVMMYYVLAIAMTITIIVIDIVIISVIAMVITYDLLLGCP